MNKTILSFLLCFVFPSVSLGMYDEDMGKTDYIIAKIPETGILANVEIPEASGIHKRANAQSKPKTVQKCTIQENYFNSGMQEYKKKTSESYKNALEYLTKATEGEDSEITAIAQHNLGVMYEKGLGTPINFETAKEFYSQAAKKGNSGSKEAVRRVSEKAEYWTYKLFGSWR